MQVDNSQQPEWLQKAEELLKTILPNDTDFVLIIAKPYLLNEKERETRAIANCCPCHLYADVQIVLDEWKTFLITTHKTEVREHKFPINLN